MAKNILNKFSKTFIEHSLSEIAKAMWNYVVLPGALFFVTPSSYQVLKNLVYGTELTTKGLFLIVAGIVPIICCFIHMWRLCTGKKAGKSSGRVKRYSVPQGLAGSALVQAVDEKNTQLKQICDFDRGVVFNEMHKMTRQFTVDLNKEIEEFDKLYQEFSVKSLTHCNEIKAIIEHYEGRKLMVNEDQEDNQKFHGDMLKRYHTCFRNEISGDEGAAGVTPEIHQSPRP